MMMACNLFFDDSRIVNKQDDNIYVDVMNFSIEEGDLIHIKIISNFDEPMVDITCEDVLVDY